MPEFANQILHCDCVKGMRKLPDECIPLTVTSPPYDGLRNYGGHLFDFEAVAKELYRVTMPGGVVIWVVQDQIVEGSETGSSLEQALHFKSLGFRLHSTMMMVTTCGKLPHRTRYTPQFHYAFVLSKGAPRAVNLIRDRPNKTKAKRQQWYARRENGRLVSGTLPSRTTPPFGERGNVWYYNVGYNQTTKDEDAFSHPALMPEAMAEDHILSWSRPGDLVFDPMCGAGTTCKIALLNDRRYLGMEIHKPYWELAVRRLSAAREQHRQKLDDFFQIGLPEPSTADPTEAATPKRRISCRTSIKKGDVLTVLKKLEDNSIDGCLYDGPYGLTSIGKKARKRQKNGVNAKGFLSQDWDGAVPSLAFCQEALRVCKPGAWMLAFGHPRTHHRLTCNIEDAGWEIRDCLMWLNGQGFPKSHDLGKAMGDEAWHGYGFALKPGYEPVIVAMKPREGSFGENARKWGVAGLNIEGCRIGPTGSKGRFPANVVLDEEAARLLDLQSPIRKNGKYRKTGGGQQNAPDSYGDAGGASRFFYCPKAKSKERNAGLDDFPIDRPDKRSGKSLGIWDKKGIQPQQNQHTCVKPLALTEWLARLILPPEQPDSRKLLIPYCGSGSEMIGALLAGWDEVVGIERDEKYVEIAEARIKWWRSHG